MTARKTYMDQIIRELSVAQNEIEFQCRLGTYDDVHYWEEIAKGLLNRCYGLQLTNLNEEKKNFPGIDLGDRERGIGVQVTAEKGSAKLNETIQTVIGKKVYEEFPHLMFFILGRKQNKYTVTQRGQTLLDFNADKDILDFEVILKKCQTMELECLKKIAEFLTGEISGGGAFGDGNARKEEAYRKHLLSSTDSILITGMEKKLPIELAWIQLRLMDEEALQELREKGAAPTPGQEEIRQTDQKFDIEAVWTSAENMVILAGPGAGKSTLLKKLVQTAAQKKQKVIWLSLMHVAGLFGQGETFDQAMRKTMAVSLPFEVSKAEFEYRLQYRFLHLNIGEYLTGKYISEMEPDEAVKWVLAHSGSAKWHETIRMAVACNDSGFLATSLRKHEEAAQLPTGEIFLAAEGLADRQTGAEAQNIYRSLLRFVVSDNKTLVRSAVSAIQGMRALIREWDKEYLLALMKSGEQRIADAAYSVYLCMSREELDQSILRQHFLDYKERAEHEFGKLSYQNMEETARYLQRDPKDREVIEAAKYYYGNHCSMYGMDVPKKQEDAKPEEYLECSRLAQGLQYMQTAIPELFAFGADLKQPWCKAVIRAVGTAVGVDAGRIKSELSCLYRESQENPEFRFYQYIREVIVCSDWSKAAEGIDEETLLKGIAANSEIIALPCMNMLVRRDGKEKTKQALLKMLYAENKEVTERIGSMAPCIWKEKSAEVILSRLLHGRLDVCAGLYCIFPELSGEFRIKDWMDAMLEGVTNDSSVPVQNACSCIKEGLRQGYLDGEAKEALLSLCKEQFEAWLGRKVKCINCDAGAYLDERGFCPKCHVKGRLPYRAFMELLIDNRCLDYQELIRYSGHCSSDISEAAREGMKSFWEENPQSIGEILEQIKADQCPENLFGWLLAMPGNVIAGYEKQIVDAAEKERRKLQLVFLEKMNRLEWLPVKEKREYLIKMMGSGDAEVKARATKVWLALE